MAEGTPRTNNDVIAELAVKAAGALTLEEIYPGVDVAAIPANMRIESVKKYMDEYRLEPERRKGTAQVVDLQSFIDLTNRFKDTDSALFAHPDPATPKLQAVFNYNRAGTGHPRFGDHRAAYSFPLSEEWVAWDAKDGEQMGQEDFAHFLEDRLIDVADPASAMDSAKQFAQKLGVRFATPQALLELSRGLEVKANVRVKQQVKLQNGEAQIQFAEEHTDEYGAPLDVPGAFIIAIPVFKNGAAYQVPSRLRYRVAGQSILWWFDLYRIDRVFDHAFQEACAKAKTDTSLPLFLGVPEA